jgi:hypothetical protein
LRIRSRSAARRVEARRIVAGVTVGIRADGQAVKRRLDKAATKPSP